MKKVIFALIAVLLVGWGGYTLFKNKKAIDAASQKKEEQMVIPVLIETVKRQTISSDFSYIGTFMPNREVAIGAEGQGKLVKVMVKEGDYVKQGQVLAKIDDEMLRIKLQAEEAALETQKAALQTAMNAQSSAQNGVETAQTMLNKSKKDLERFENLLKENATTDIAVQNAKIGVTQAENGLNQAQMAVKQAIMGVEQARFGIKQAETQIASTNKMIEQTQLKAPVSGVLTSRMFDLGSMVGPGAPLGMVTDVSTLKLTVMIPEADILKFSEGQKVGVKTDIYSDKTFGGTVSLISVKSDNAHSYKMEIAVANSGDSPIKAGMYGRLTGETKGGVEGIFIPRNVLLGSIQEPKVFVVQGSKAVLKPIVLGVSSGDWLEVKEGLTEGEQLVTSGQINLDNGSPVTIQLQGAVEAK